jgi:hypothetical protein
MLESLIGILGVAFLGVAGWMTNLGNRVSVIEAQFEALKELIETRFDDMDRRLERIEKSMNGRLRD